MYRCGRIGADISGIWTHFTLDLKLILNLRLNLDLKLNLNLNISLTFKIHFNEKVKVNGQFRFKHNITLLNHLAKSTQRIVLQTPFIIEFIDMFYRKWDGGLSDRK